jgi:putative nucleotidyltransferase with HDIG domain
VRQANERLRIANEDLRELFQFASGLAARAHDRERLVDYAEMSLSKLTGGRGRLDRIEDDGAVPLVTGDAPVAWVQFEDGEDFDRERWARLRETLLPQLATAIEGADAAERLRKVHLDTIAALSRSMEAKDYYTGGHTERVATVAVALARHLGFAQGDIEAIEVGALLHDIGKIGVPEHILRKDTAREQDEWAVMKEHPVLSDYILSEIDLPPIVREIARSHHERVDGTGYPDRLRGEEIPLSARIVLVADAFDALTSDRPYRRARPAWAALEELRANAGTQFCPRVVVALEELYHTEPAALSEPPRRGFTPKNSSQLAS